MKRLIVIVAVVALLALGGIAQGTTVSYTVGGWTQQFPGPVTPPANAPWGVDGYPGDTVEFQTYTGTFDLVLGSSVQKINTLLWSIDYTYGGTPEPWPDMPLGFSAIRNISIDSGPTVDFSQQGLLRVNYYNDYLSIDGGATVEYFTAGYKVDITPLGLAEVGGSDFDDGNPWVQPSRDVMARFEVTEAPPVPEPMSIMLGIMGLGSIAGFRRLRRK